MKTLSRETVVTAIREAANEEYAISDKAGLALYGDAGAQRLINEIQRFFAQKIIIKIDALEAAEQTPTEVKKSSHNIIRDAMKEIALCLKDFMFVWNAEEGYVGIAQLQDRIDVVIAKLNE